MRGAEAAQRARSDMREGKRGSKVTGTIQAAKRGLSRRLLATPGVSGVGIGDDRDGNEHITVYVAEDSPDLRSSLPASVDGYRVVVEPVGPIRASSPRPE